MNHVHWIPSDTTLRGGAVELHPLQEKHFEELAKLAAEKKIWEFIPNDMSTHEKIYAAFRAAIIQKESGFQFPFVVWHQQTQQIIGSTRLMNIEQPHRKLEIGWTWLHPDYWATSVNLECKLLLLTYCFEELKAIRVQLKTDENNIRSRKAIEKIGGTFEGILRNDWIRDNGTVRNSAYFSIIEAEWHDVNSKLTALLHERNLIKIQPFVK